MTQASMHEETDPVVVVPSARDVQRRTTAGNGETLGANRVLAPLLLLCKTHMQHGKYQIYAS